jgi:hypothetical protein
MCIKEKTIYCLCCLALGASLALSLTTIFHKSADIKACERFLGDVQANEALILLSQSIKE